MQNYILLVDCSDEKGLIHKITGVLYENGLNIVSNSEFVELESDHFFMRSEFTGEVDEDIINAQLEGVLPDDAKINLIKQRKKKIIIFVTKEHHCLGDLLIKNEYNEINAEIISVISNYPDLKSLVDKFSIPFFYINHKDKTREEHEEEMANYVVFPS